MKRFNILILAVAAVVIFYILKQQPVKVDVSKYEEAIKALEQKVDSLHSENNALTLQADSLENKINQYDVTIKNLNLRINVIKQETQAKVDSVDYFGDDELERFFAERYKADSTSRQHNNPIN